MNKSTDYDETLYRLQINLKDYKLFHYTLLVYNDFLLDYQDYEKIHNEFIHIPIFTLKKKNLGQFVKVMKFSNVRLQKST